MNDQQLSLPLSVEDQAFVHLEAETGRRRHTVREVTCGRCER
jgi:hypothetical protein